MSGNRFVSQVSIKMPMKGKAVITIVTQATIRINLSRVEQADMD